MNKLRVNDITSLSQYKTEKEKQTNASNLFICAHFNSKPVQLYSNWCIFLSFNSKSFRIHTDCKWPIFVNNTFSFFSPRVSPKSLAQKMCK